MTICIKRTLDELEVELQSVELSLRNSSRCYETSQLLCIDCGRTLPGQAKKCHPCHNTELPQRYCTSDTRVADYFAILRRVELWPTAKRFGTYSVSDTAFRFTCAKTDLKHNCTAGINCPLLVNLNSLSERVDRIKRNMNGFCLRCIREDDEWEETKKCAHI
jgi:ribosomal protein L40E